MSEVRRLIGRVPNVQHIPRPHEDQSHLMEATMGTKTIEVTGDGKTVWVNGSGRCLARFSEYGYEVLSFGASVMEGGEGYIEGGAPKPTTEGDWKHFVTKVKEMHDVDVDPRFMPNRLKAFPSLLDAALGSLVKRVKPAGASDHADAQNAFDDVRSTIATNPGSSTANLKSVLEKILGPIDETGTRIAGNEMTFISAAPDDDGFHTTLTVRF